MSTLPASGYASAASSSTSLPSTSTSKSSSKQKPVNVFSNDGSFLERFQRSKQEEEDKQKVDEALAKKKQFADRFKNRGKRPPDSPSTVTSIDLDPNPVKKPKLDDVPSPAYQKQVRDQQGRILRDTGTGVRPLVK
ncbi:hypothetical protein L210DRAFT_3396560 [Boletus edulis BED1]|uniref:Uncharacterized protein n=1 Tax=Boletus edulis BED1 TaxID=1328754 RepID=A0AAD4GH08_BOLED|nr:hypothetical protein L210DRAFT_3396560 [Boletus edulis BED1]